MQNFCTTGSSIVYRGKFLPAVHTDWLILECEPSEEKLLLVGVPLRAWLTPLGGCLGLSRSSRSFALGSARLALRGISKRVGKRRGGELLQHLRRKRGVCGSCLLRAHSGTWVDRQARWMHEVTGLRGSTGYGRKRDSCAHELLSVACVAELGRGRKR